MIFKFNKYFFENKNIDVDPFGEEDWNEENTKKELVKNCVYDIIYNAHDYRHYLEDILTEHFKDKTIDELKEFLGYNEYEEE